jgi:hypothetical protein
VAYNDVIVSTQITGCFIHRGSYRIETISHDNLGLANRIAQLDDLTPDALDFLGRGHNRVWDRNQLEAKTSSRITVIATNVIRHHQCDIVASFDEPRRQGGKGMYIPFASPSLQSNFHYVAFANMREGALSAAVAAFRKLLNAYPMAAYGRVGTVEMQICSPNTGRSTESEHAVTIEIGLLPRRAGNGRQQPTGDSAQSTAIAAKPTAELEELGPGLSEGAG